MPNPIGLNRVQVDFVQTELVLARTFCHIAESSGSSDRSSCVGYARAAYDAASRFMLKAGMSTAEFATFTANLEEVKQRVEALESSIGARFVI